MIRPAERFILTLSAALLFAGPLYAESSIHGLHENVENWRPNKFVILCGDTSSFRFLDDISCIGKEKKDDFEFYLRLASQEYERLRFRSPDGFGPVIEHPDTGEEVVRIYAEALEGASANVASLGGTKFSEACRPDAPQRMTVDPQALESWPEFAIAALAAHELFHTVQGALPEGRKRNPHRWGECYPPRWILEGQSDAMAINFYRKYFPQEFPVRDIKFRSTYAGLRPYNIPLYWTFDESNKSFAYLTSSFWLHIGDRYRNGDFRYLQDFNFKPAPTYGGGKEDWLKWLDDNLREDSRIATPLYRVFPGFLTHFLGAHEKGGVGDSVGEYEWEASGFKACKWLFVSPEEPYVERDVELYPMSGLCLSVMVTGLKPGQLASVKLAAYTTRRHVDALHMGFAYTDDATGFNCGYAVRKNRLPRGKLECLLEPVTTIASDSRNPDEPAVRYWNGILVEAGFQGVDPQTERSERESGEFLDPIEQSQNAQALPDDQGPADPNQIVNITNRYALSYVPPEPRLSELEGRGKVTITIAVGLEVASLAVNGKDVDQGATDGRRASTRKRSVAAAGPTALETNIFAPPSTGYVDDAGLVFSDGLSEQLAGIRELTTRMIDDAVARLGKGWVDDGFQRLRLAEAEITPLGDPFNTEKIEVLREFEIRSEEPLPEGVTGTFNAVVLGIDRKKQRLFFLEKLGDVKIIVIENSREVFRARVEGRLCEGALTIDAFKARMQARQPWCESRFSFSGEIIKPFAFAYRRGQIPVSRLTPGEKLYNEYGPDRSGRVAAAGSGTGASGAAGSGTGSSASSGTGRTLLCDCSCPGQAASRTAQCRAQCAAQAAECQTPEAPAAKPPAPTLAAQTKWFSRLVSGQGLSPDAEQMLVDDFATMSDETRAYLIKKYRNGVR